jgi:hypothetical protein
MPGKTCTFYKEIHCINLKTTKQLQEQEDLTWQKNSAAF